jgi:hypothetical protein
MSRITIDTLNPVTPLTREAMASTVGGLVVATRPRIVSEGGGYQCYFVSVGGVPTIICRRSSAARAARATR